MLALVKNGKFISRHREGSRIDIDGISVLGAYNAWEYGDYSLHTIQDAAPVPEGKIVTNTTVELVGEHWTYVHTLEDEPVLTHEELRAQMPDKTPREFRDILIDEGILTDASPDEVTLAIQQIPYDKERTKALNAWQNPTMFSRSDPYIDMIGALFGLSPEDIDVLWMGHDES